jgi:hypothetical protein
LLQVGINIIIVHTIFERVSDVNLLLSISVGSGEEVVHEGLKLHATGGWHKAVGTTMAGVMWYVVCACSILSILRLCL